MLMCGGLLVHASVAIEPVALFRVVDIVSQAFRMGAFFALSGYLTGLALRRRAARDWLPGRLRQLGIPAAVGVLLLSPLVWLLHASSPALDHRPAPIPPTMPFEWLHIWFLFGLIVYSLAACLVDWLDRRDDLIATIVRVVPQRAVLLTVATATALLFAATPPALRLVLSPSMIHAYSNVQLIAGYLPTFLFGFILARSPYLQDAILADWRRAAAIVGVVALILCLVLADVAPGLEDHARFLAAAICPPAALVLILRSTLTMGRIPETVRRIADASYTVYLLHVPIAVAINTRMAPLGWDAHVQYGCAVVLTGASSYAVHRLLVRRSAILSLLLNGKAVAAPARTIAVPSGGTAPT